MFAFDADRRGSTCECGDHVFAPTNLGFVILVSPEDASQFSYRWSVTLKGTYPKVRRSQHVPVRKTLALAREIYGPTPEPIIDHWNLNSLDNRRGNLRPASYAQNTQNQRGRKKITGLPKGVHPTRNGDRYYAAISAHRVTKHLGVFDTPELAAAAYREAAAVLHGEFARVE